MLPHRDYSVNIFSTERFFGLFGFFGTTLPYGIPTGQPARFLRLIEMIIKEAHNALIPIRSQSNVVRMAT